ncbi:MAG: transposase [Chitinophagaceae bacterium]|nr:transposase [Chitinophagaceae bacterium]
MAFVNIMIHAVWGTKNRYPFSEKEIRPIIFEHIRQNAKSKQIFIDSINGVEGTHVLLGLKCRYDNCKSNTTYKRAIASFGSISKTNCCCF